MKSVYRRTHSTQPWEVPLLRVVVPDVLLLILTDCDLSDRKFSTQLLRDGVSPRVKNFSESFCGITMLNAEL